MRDLKGVWAKIVMVLAVAMTFYHILCNTVILLPTIAFRAYHLVFVAVLVFLLYPSFPARSIKNRPSFFDIILVFLSIAVGIYVAQTYLSIEYITTKTSKIGLLMGIIALLIVIEINRRTVGNVITLLVSFFLLYPFITFLPGPFAHRGFTLTRVVSTFYLELEGIYGVALGAMAYYIFLFLLYGALLNQTGASKSFINLAFSLTGKYKGGGAYTAVIASGLCAMISGQAAANVATTGTFTIPIMKRTGFQPHEAGAIEAYASTGGLITPPVMGSAAFIMAEWLGISYWEVCVYAICPALLYYFAAWCSIYGFVGNNKEISLIAKGDIPNFRKTFMESLLYLTSPIVLIILLFQRFTVTQAVLWAICILLVISILKKEISIKKLFQAFHEAAVLSLKVAPLCAAAGIVAASVGLTGVGIRLSELAFSIAGNIYIGTLIVGVMSLIFGMGLPAVASYIMVAILAAPILVKMGVIPVVSHFIVFWFSIFANITPPVAIAAFVAAGMSGSDYIKTGLTACKIAIPSFLIPFFILMNNGLLIGAPLDKIMLMTYIALLIIIINSCITGYLRKQLLMIERSILAIVACLLIWLMKLSYWEVGFGIAVLTIGLMWFAIFIPKKTTEQISK